MVAALTLWQASSRQLDLAALLFGLIGLVATGTAAAAAIWTYGCQRLGYQLLSDSLAVIWLGRLELIPYSQIQAVYSGDRLERMRAPRALLGFDFGGRRGWAKSVGATCFYVTSEDPGEMAVLITPGLAYVLTPSDSIGFRRSLIERAKSAGERHLPVSGRGDSGLEPLLSSPTAPALIPLAIAGAVLALSALFVADRYPSLPAMLGLYADSLGRGGLMMPKWGLLVVLFAGVAVLAANVAIGLKLRRDEAFATGLIWSLTPLVAAGWLLAILRLAQ